MKQTKYLLLVILIFAFGFFNLANAVDLNQQYNQQYSQQNTQAKNKNMQTNLPPSISLAQPITQTTNYMPGYAPDYVESQAKLTQLSSVEKLFSSDINDPLNQEKFELKQIGYDFFTKPGVLGFGKYDGSYKLNLGEKVDVYFWGDSVDMLSISGSSMLSPVTKSQVDTKGNIFIPGVGIVKAEGRSITDVENDIQTQASQKFANTKVRITVADSTEFAIFVYGDVLKPGKVTVSNNSSIIEALAAAGGVSKNGSLRNITYKSSGKTQKVDLYQPLFKGKDSGLILKPNDTIFVNHLGSVVALKNGVKQPGIYEAVSTDSLSDMIEYAGGFLPATDKNIINVKAYNSKDGERISMDVPSSLHKKTKIMNGDILEFKNLYGKAENYVSLEGNVKHPGIFEYKKGMKLSDVLKNKNELQNETFVYQAVIKRISGDDKQVKTIPVSLDEFFRGGNNPELKPQDIITVFKNTNSDFIEVYGCINKPKRIPYNEKLTLKDVMTDLQFIKSVDSKNVHNVSTTSNNTVIIPAYDVALEITNTGTIRTLYLYDVLIQNDGIDIAVNLGDKFFFRPLRENEILKSVKVSGFVNKPGVYNFVEGKKLSEMIEEAGGLSKDADMRGIVFKRVQLSQKEKQMLLEKNEKDIEMIKGIMANDSNVKEGDTSARQATIDAISQQNKNQSVKAMGRVALDIKNHDLSKLSEAQNIIIQDGDEIYIPKFSNHVMVLGEVYNETSFIYKEKEKAHYYVKLVGGFTPNARKTKLYKIGVNGRAQKLNLLATNKIEPGDTIIVPRKLGGNDWIQPLASTMQAIASMLTAVFIVMKL